MDSNRILVIGAGAAGLMAARELAKSGKNVVILEARDRIGGRIWPLSQSEFDYEAQGGAEFTHGKAPVTKSLLNEAGLTYLPMPSDGEMWIFDGKLKRGYLITEHPEFLRHKNEIDEKLKELKEDVPISDFLEKFFTGDEYLDLRELIIRMVQSFDAADANQISTFSLREEWLGKEEWVQGRVKEGYGAVLNFLESECKKRGVKILLNKMVDKIEFNANPANVHCADGSNYEALKIIVTVPAPTIKQIQFQPPIPEKVKAADDIGFGQVIKVLFKFRDQWWRKINGRDMSRTIFILCNKGKFNAWWTQYPENVPILTGWIAGQNAVELKDKSSEEIIGLGTDSLSGVFGIDKTIIQSNLAIYKVANWPNDRFSQGAYSYSTIHSEKAYAELRKPINGKIFFAGEALHSKLETATVEGALASGLETAKKILAK